MKKVAFLLLFILAIMVCMSAYYLSQRNTAPTAPRGTVYVPTQSVVWVDLPTQTVMPAVTLPASFKPPEE